MFRLNLPIFRKIRQRRVSREHPEIDSDEEIWNTIRYLDPDRELRKSDIVLGMIWTLVSVSLGLFIFLLHH